MAVVTFTFDGYDTSSILGPDGHVVYLNCRYVFGRGGMHKSIFRRKNTRLRDAYTIYMDEKGVPAPIYSDIYDLKYNIRDTYDSGFYATSLENAPFLGIAKKGSPAFGGDYLSTIYAAKYSYILPKNIDGGYNDYNETAYSIFRINPITNDLFFCFIKIPVFNSLYFNDIYRVDYFGNHVHDDRPEVSREISDPSAGVISIKAGYIIKNGIVRGTASAVIDIHKFADWFKTRMNITYIGHPPYFWRM